MPFRSLIIVLLQHLLGSLIRLSHPPVRAPSEVYRILVLVCLVPHTGILEGEHAQPELFRLPDDHVLDGLELLLLGQRLMVPGNILVVPLQLIPEPVPVIVALGYLRYLGQLVHDGVRLGLHRLGKVAVDLLAVDF